VRRMAILMAAVLFLAAGCSTAAGADGTGQNVFGTFGPARPGQEGAYTDAEVPTGILENFSINPLHNYTSHTVRLRSARMIAPLGPGVQVVSIRAYPIRQVGMGQLFGGQGDLAKDCPNYFQPHPLTDVKVRPHSGSKWIIILTVIFERPGKYRFGWAHLTFTTAGQRGWQTYFTGDMRITAIPPSQDPRLIQPQAIADPGHVRDLGAHGT
jgi:hypothetical protein